MNLLSKEIKMKKQVVINDTFVGDPKIAKTIRKPIKRIPDSDFNEALKSLESAAKGLLDSCEKRFK